MQFGILNSDHLLRNPIVPRHLFVVGGGYIGCELAAIYRALGTRVTLAEVKSRCYRVGIRLQVSNFVVSWRQPGLKFS